jgi:hypothetical protein
MIVVFRGMKARAGYEPEVKTRRALEIGEVTDWSLQTMLPSAGHVINTSDVGPASRPITGSMRSGSDNNCFPLLRAVISMQETVLTCC